MTQAGWWTQTAWLTSENPHHLLVVLEKQGIRSSRKYRLATIACCYRVRDRFSAAGRHTLEITERYADRQARFAEMIAGREQTAVRGHFEVDILAFEATHREAKLGLAQVLHTMLGVAWGGPEMTYPHGWLWPEPNTWKGECRMLCHLIRDIFGNPFHPASIPPCVLAWNGGMVRRLAEGIYRECAFDRLPIVADALEEAGCTDTNILDHCRQPGEHVRGCWPVDLVLGKE